MKREHEPPHQTIMQGDAREEMKITILNGNPDADNAAFDDYLKRLSDALTSDGHTVAVFELREMDIKYCIGCFGCWVKTPGECIVPDESRDVRRAAIHSDLVLWASPVIMGFYSALLKKVTDKFLPLLHPYTVVDQGEAHHLARYDKYPLVGLLLEKGADTDDEDIKVISDIHRRTALNFKSTLSLAKLTQAPIEEVAREINSL
jgi:multimeric flavodoxin WrbA